MASRASGQRRPREAGPSRTTMVEQVSGAPAPAAHSCPSAPSAPAPATPHPRQRTSSDLSLLVELAAAKMASVEAGASAEPVTEVRGGTHREVHHRKDSLLSRASVMDASTRKLLSSGAAEALGLGIICFFGCMGTLNGPLGIALPHIQVALTFGLVVMVAIACFAHISGAHFNPAVTLMSLIMRLIDIKTALVYFVSQCIGGTLGYGMLKVLTPNNLLYWGRAVGVNGTFEGAGPCCTVPHGGLSPAQAVLGELLGTAALLMLCCAVWDPRNAANTDGIPLKFGLLIAGVAMCLGPYTGASLNPARSLAPAIWEGTWTHHWVYWVGPLSAAVLLGYGWPILFAPVDEPAVKDKADMPLTLVSTDGKRHSRLADDDDAKLGY